MRERERERESVQSDWPELNWTAICQCSSTQFSCTARTVEREWTDLVYFSSVHFVRSERLLRDLGQTRTRTLPKLPLPSTLTKLKSSMWYFLTVGVRRRGGFTAGRSMLLLLLGGSLLTQMMLVPDLEAPVATASALVPGCADGWRRSTTWGSTLASWESGLSTILLVVLLRISYTSE